MLKDQNQKKTRTLLFPDFPLMFWVVSAVSKKNSNLDCKALIGLHTLTMQFVQVTRTPKCFLS